MRSKGTITTWHDEKGYGVDEVVTYALSTDRQGRPCAVSATLAGDRLQQNTRRSRGLLSVTSAAVFIAIVGASVLAARIPPVIFVVYLVASVITFLVYAKDKSAARKGAQRTPENRLHLLALFGGWPGALVAQQKLRHKSSKQSFRLVFWATVFLNVGYYVWLYTPDGTAALQELIGRLA